jgi:hypothetical protein
LLYAVARQKIEKLLHHAAQREVGTTTDVPTAGWADPVNAPSFRINWKGYPEKLYYENWQRKLSHYSSTKGAK